jgi:hypothetical protein
MADTSLLSEQDWKTNVFRKRGELVSRDIAGETILVPIKGKLADMQRIFSLNPVASYIWGRLDGERSLGAVVKDIVDNFDVGQTEAEGDLKELIEELVKASLLEAAV